MKKSTENKLTKTMPLLQISEADFRNNLGLSEQNKYYTMDECDIFIQEKCINMQLVKKRKSAYYYNVPCAFDIETSSFYNHRAEKCATMYIWVFGINGACIVGRTWQEFLTLCKKLKDFLDLSEKKQLVCYVHNLSFEHQFFQHWFTWIDSFCLDERKPSMLLCDMGICFKCSLILSGYSLAKLGENLTKYKCQKMVGDLDYSLIRGIKTKMTEKEMGYILHDALVVMCYIQERIEIDGNITKIPMTKTGYVRRLCRNNCLYGNKERHDTHEVGKQYQRYRNIIKPLTLEVDEYNLAKRCFQGGFTHANAEYSCRDGLKDISSYDLCSAYPTVMVTKLYPMSKGFRYRPSSIEDFEKQNRYYCTMFDIEITGIQSRISFEHYLSVSKCWEISGEITDNGRLVSADRIVTSLTNVDYEIMKKVYKWKSIKIGRMYCYKKYYLPTEYVQTVLDLYRDKTTLKGIPEKEVEYFSAKADLNSLYGMSVTDICRPVIKYTDKWEKTEAELEKTIETYNNSKQRFLSYLWGIFVTAYNRYILWEYGILKCKHDYIYADTDSVKIRHREKHQADFDEYNSIVQKELEKACKYHGFSLDLIRPKTIKGVEKPLGVFEHECDYEFFKTLGAKRYLTWTDGKPHITVSGLSKGKAEEYLVTKYKTRENIFEHFTDGLYIPGENTGKNVHTYIDEPCDGLFTDYQGNICEYHELSYVHLEPADYSLSLAREYSDFLMHMQTITD